MTQAMIKSALNAALPLGTAMSMLKKIPGPISNFIQGATASGWAADKVVDYLREQISLPDQEDEKKRLQQRRGEGTITSEERRHLNTREEDVDIGSVVKPAAALAGGLAAATMMPPGAGGAIGQLSGAGQIVDALGSKGGEQAQPQQQNIIQHYFPKLADAIESAIQQRNGDVNQATQYVRSVGAYDNDIKMLEETAQAGFEDLINEYYGGGGQPQQPQQQQQAPQQQQDVSNADSALMNILSQFEGILG